MKAIAMLIAAALAAVVPLLISDNPLSPSEWINVVVIALGGAQVYITKNLEGTVWVYSKLFMALLAAALVGFVSFLSDGLSATEVQQIMIAAIAALGVFATNGPVGVEEGRHAAP